tara:strand:+ start:971 stop:1987 length:1017 start_codon:yes stop_codon:yes gene_type:complete
MATIIRRKWEHRISFQVKIRRAGIRPITKTFITKTEAKKWARSMETKLDKGDFSDYSEASKLTLGDIAKRYIEGEYHRKKKGWRYEEYRYGQLLEDSISKVNLLRLSSKHLAEYRDRRLLDVESATWNKDFNFISVLINTAIFDWGIYLPNNPCKLIKRLKEPAPRNRILVGDEYDRLIKATALTENIYFVPAINFSLETAIRKGELLKARYENVNFTERTLFIPYTKTGSLDRYQTSERTIPLSVLAVSIIRKLPRHISGRIFATTDDALSNCWKKAIKKADIKNLRWHDLRRSAVGLMFDKGLSVPEIQLVGGWKNPMVLLNTYTKLNPKKIAQKI